MLELITSKVIRNGAEVLELYRVAGYRGATECYRLIWADAVPQRGRKARLLDVKDFPRADRAVLVFNKAR
jgi:hypothetical protein